MLRSSGCIDILRETLINSNVWSRESFTLPVAEHFKIPLILIRIRPGKPEHTERSPPVGAPSVRTPTYGVCWASQMMK